MEIIPAINCDNQDCFLKKIEIVRNKLKNINWLQIDVGDGKFSVVENFYDLDVLKKIKKELNLKLEIHLMVKDLFSYLNNFLFADRIIFHFEVIKNDSSFFAKIFELSAEKNFEIMLALKKDSDFFDLRNYLDGIDYVQFLGVEPGVSGGTLDDEIIPKIKDFHELYPEIFIEVDGGVNLENIRKLKEVGVNLFVVGSSIFNHVEPAKYYQKLKEEISLPGIKKND